MSDWADEKAQDLVSGNSYGHAGDLIADIAAALRAEREKGKLLGKTEEWEQIASTAKEEKKGWLLRKAAKYREAARKSEPPQQEPNNAD